MAYRPLNEWNEITKRGGEDWRLLTRKINDALDFLHTLASGFLGVKNSVVADSEDGKLQLENDLTAEELAALGYPVNYGADETGARGFKRDFGGYVGTKQVDESNIGNTKMMEYDATLDKVKYVAKPTGSGTGAGFLVLPYLLYRTAAGGSFTGYMDVQMQVSAAADFATTIYDLDSGTSQTGWYAFSGASGEYLAWAAAGMPATDSWGVAYTGTLTVAKGYYMRWRVYEHGTSNYTDWYPGGVI